MDNISRTITESSIINTRLLSEEEGCSSVKLAWESDLSEVLGMGFLVLPDNKISPDSIRSAAFKRV